MHYIHVLMPESLILVGTTNTRWMWSCPMARRCRDGESGLQVTNWLRSTSLSDFSIRALKTRIFTRRVPEASAGFHPSAVLRRFASESLRRGEHVDAAISTGLMTPTSLLFSMTGRPSEKLLDHIRSATLQDRRGDAGHRGLQTHRGGEFTSDRFCVARVFWWLPSRSFAKIRSRFGPVGQSLRHPLQFPLACPRGSRELVPDERVATSAFVPQFLPIWLPRAGESSPGPDSRARRCTGRGAIIQIRRRVEKAIDVLPNLLQPECCR